MTADAEIPSQAACPGQVVREGTVRLAGDRSRPRGWRLLKRSTFPTFSAYWLSSVMWLRWLYVDPDLAGSAPGSSGCRRGYRNEEIQWEK